MDKKISEVSARIEGEHYMKWTRLEEIISFSGQMGLTSIGISQSIGLITEVKKKLLTNNNIIALN